MIKEEGEKSEQVFRFKIKDLTYLTKKPLVLVEIWKPLDCEDSRCFFSQSMYKRHLA